MKEFIAWLCAKRQITLTELTRLLEYKSKTSLVRIQNGPVRMSTLTDFSKRIQANLHPDAEEADRMKQAIDQTVKGAEKLAERYEMWNFLSGQYGREEDKKGTRFSVINAKDGEKTDFVSLYRDTVSLEIKIANCALFPIMDAVKELICDHPERKVIQLLVMIPGQSSRTIRMINAVMPVFYLNNYDAYYIENDGSMLPQPGNMITVKGIRKQDGEGVSFYDLLMPDREDEAIRYSFPAADNMRESLFSRMKDRMKPLKQAYFSCASFENYIQYCADYGALEHDCAIWKVKPDIGLDYIPNDIQYASMKDGALAQDPSFEDVMRILWDIQGGRYDNYRTKKQLARTVMKYSAMLKFARTGRHSDHFWGMRPFTPEERKRILSTLLEVTENNGNFIPNFLRDDSTLRDIEIAYYEGKGFLILRSDTSYDLQAGHSELMLHCEPMEKEYKDFFVNELVPKYCYSRNETAQMIRKLIRMCDEKQP